MECSAFPPEHIMHAPPPSIFRVSCVSSLQKAEKHSDTSSFGTERKPRTSVVNVHSLFHSVTPEAT